MQTETLLAAIAAMLICIARVHVKIYTGVNQLTQYEDDKWKYECGVYYKRRHKSIE